MKKILIITGSIIILLAILYVAIPYKIKTVCFGDVCPQNGGTYLMYRAHYTELECTNKGGTPIVGIGWGRVYAGCSPNNALSRFFDERFNK